MTDAYEDLNSQYVAAGKAIKPECECGFWMVATPKEKGYLWTCGRIECKKTRFEKFDK